jgi:hypothetical protein
MNMLLGAVFFTEPPLKIDFQQRLWLCSYSASRQGTNGFLSQLSVLEWETSVKIIPVLVRHTLALWWSFIFTFFFCDL